jgi:hypothetical protein
VRRTQPGVYLKVLALLLPREHRLEHTSPVKALSDEQLAAMIGELEERIASRLQGADAKVIDAQAEPVLALPDQPAAVSRKRNLKGIPERLAKARE